MFMVSAMRTLVNKDSTSKEARFPLELDVRKICKKSSVEFIWNFAGKYGEISWFSFFAVL